MEMMIDTKKLRLAQIRYFEAKKNASEVLDERVYAFLYEINGTFVNVLNFTREYPVLGRTVYHNYTLDGEPHGNKLSVVSGELKDGLCYILERCDCSSLFNSDSIRFDDLLLYVINSDKFFIDRIAMLEKASGLSKFIIKRKLKEDYQKLDVFYDYLDSKEQARQYNKRN